MKFSQRIGITPATKTIQVKVMDTELRNGLWNALKIYFIDPLEKYTEYSGGSEFDIFCKILWLHFYKLPIDTIPDNQYHSESFIRERFFKSQWFEVYDFLEFVANINPQTIRYDSYKLKEFCKKIFETM